MGVECRHFGSCSAPLCPLDAESLRRGLWYPDEEICRNKRFSKLRWIKVQRRIARLHAEHGVRGFFTYEMLCSIRQVRRGIKGLDSDHPPLKRPFLMGDPP